MATPTVPSIATGNQQFSTDMRAFHEWEAGELWTAVDSFFNTRLLGTTDTSSSSVLIGTGDKTFTVTAGKAFAAGMSVNVVNTANPANYMSGFVKSYSSTTLVVTVITTGGSGTLAAWSIALGLSGGGATLGANVFTALQRWTTGSNIASSATVDLTAATGNTVNITGTVATSAFTITAGQWMLLIPTGAWPLTYNATTCNINGGASYTCAAGDRVIVTKALDGVTYVNIIKQSDAATTTSSGIAELATTAEMAARTDTVRAVTPASLQGIVTSGSVINTTSGTSHDFTGIPSWAKLITINISGVSTNGTSPLLFQIGDSGGIENTGYSGAVMDVSAAAYHSAGFQIQNSSAAAQAWHGSFTLSLLSGNTWSISGGISSTSSGYIATFSGSKDLSATLDRVRLTTVNGTDTFDSGTFNILYR